MAPRRVAGSVFSAIRYPTVPSPWPSRADVSVIHPAELDADHAQSRATAMVTVPVPPDAPNEVEELLTVAWQRVSVGAVTLVSVELPHAAASAASSGRAIVARRFTTLRNAQ